MLSVSMEVRNFMKNILFFVSITLFIFCGYCCPGIFFIFSEVKLSPIMASFAWNINIFPPVCFMFSYTYSRTDMKLLPCFVFFYAISSNESKNANSFSWFIQALPLSQKECSPGCGKYCSWWKGPKCCIKPQAPRNRIRELSRRRCRSIFAFHWVTREPALPSLRSQSSPAYG